MNEKFFALSKAKRQSIINSGLEVFAKNPYKRASTEEIAAKAGISKGLLFHYFRNKREFYNFLYDYSEELLRRSLAEMPAETERDFFAIMTWATDKRVELLKDNPWLAPFAARAYYSKNEAISPDMDRAVENSMSGVMERYFKNVDFAAFKDDVEPERILKMLVWLSDGYIHEQERRGNLDVDALIEEYHFWCGLLRKSVYKEEYLNGSN